MAKPRKKTFGPCVTDGCDRKAEHKESSLCKRCYAFQHYWVGRSVTDKMKRVKQIEYWNRRAHQMLMPSNVTSMRGKRKTG